MKLEAAGPHGVGQLGRCRPPKEELMVVTVFRDVGGGTLGQRLREGLW